MIIVRHIIVNMFAPLHFKDHWKNFFYVWADWGKLKSMGDGKEKS